MLPSPEFPIEYCPLCDELLEADNDGPLDPPTLESTFYSCRTQASPLFPERMGAHYFVIKNDKNMSQHVYVYPYAIDTADNITRVYVYNHKSLDFALEMSAIKITSPNELIARIKKLMVFM